MENVNDMPILWGPVTGKSLKKMYPELAAEPLFKELKNDELLFAWYVGCKSSPIDPDLEETIRYRQAATQAFPNSQEKRNKFAAKNISDEIRLAIEKMATYSPKAREIAARITQNDFHTLLKMSDVDINKDFNYIDKEGVKRIDFGARKQHIDSIKLRSEVMPNLIRQMEEGFGIEKTRKEEMGGGQKAIEKYHNDKKNQTS